MKSLWLKIMAAALFFAVAGGIMSLVGRADDGDASNLRARLKDFGEVPPQLTGGAGTFHGKLNDAGTRIDWTLTYTGLTGAAQMAHIHFGPRQNTGAIVVFFCSSVAGGTGSRNGGTITTGAATAAAFACPDDGTPAHAGTVTGFWTAADVQAQPTQNVAAGNFAGLVRFIRAGLGYCNVHTVAHPGGEIRGQVNVRDDDDDDE